MEEMIDYEMCVLVAPDGTPQPTTLADDFATVIAVVEMLAASKMGKPMAALFEEGYKIIPVKMTLKQNGTEEDAFNRMKEQIEKGS